MYVSLRISALLLSSLFALNNAIPPPSPIPFEDVNRSNIEALVCQQCLEYQEKIIYLQQLNYDLLKEVYVYRNILELDDNSVKTFSEQLVKELEKELDHQGNSAVAATN